MGSVCCRRVVRGGVYSLAALVLPAELGCGSSLGYTR